MRLFFFSWLMLATLLAAQGRHINITFSSNQTNFQLCSSLNIRNLTQSAEVTRKNISLDLHLTLLNTCSDEVSKIIAVNLKEQNNDVVSALKAFKLVTQGKSSDDALRIIKNMIAALPQHLRVPARDPDGRVLDSRGPVQYISELEIKYGDQVLRYVQHHISLPVIKYLISKYVDIKTYDDKGAPIVHIAADQGALEVLEYLIKELKYDIDTRDKFLQTPLFYSIKKDNLNVVEWLLLHGANVNATTGSGDSAIVCASVFNRPKILKLLIKHNGFVNHKNRDDETALFGASKMEKLDIMKILVTEDKADVTIRNKLGLTLLHVTAKEKRLDKMKILINEGKTNVNVRNNDGETPLHVAVNMTHLEMVKLLVTEGKSNVNAKDKLGNTPLMNAAHIGNLEVFKYLFYEHAVETNARNNEGDNILHEAAYEGHLNIVEFLIKEAKFEVDVRNIDEETPLHKAAYMGHFDIVKFLVMQGKADSNIKDDDGYTPLHAAAYNGGLKVVKFLVKNANSEVNARGHNGQTPLDFAKLSSILEAEKVVKFLQNNNNNKSTQ